MDPVALVAGGGEEVAEQFRPAIGGLPLPVSHGHQLLGAVGAHPDDHQTAQRGLLQPHPEVDPVRPHVHVIPLGEVTLAEGLVVGLPAG